MALHRKLIEDLTPLVLRPIYSRPGEVHRAHRHAIPEVETHPTPPGSSSTTS